MQCAVRPSMCGSCWHLDAGISAWSTSEAVRSPAPASSRTACRPAAPAAATMQASLGLETCGVTRPLNAFSRSQVRTPSWDIRSSLAPTPLELGVDDAGVQRVDGRVGGHRQPPRELVGEQHVGELALAVRRPALVIARALQVLEVDVAVQVRQRRDVDDAARPAEASCRLVSQPGWLVPHACCRTGSRLS